MRWQENCTELIIFVESLERVIAREIAFKPIEDRNLKTNDLYFNYENC